MAQQFEFQSSSLSDLCGWKPDLEARFSRLQAMVEDLQRAQPASTTAASGFAAAPLGTVASCNSKGAIHGQFGLGDDSTLEGPSTVATVPPSVPLVTGTLSLQHPLTAIAKPQHISSQIIASLGVNAPSFPFPPFTGDNPNLWITLAEQYFSMFATHESYWVPMSILHFSGAAGVWLQSVWNKIAALD
jgi:hypothetical protein